MPDTFAFQAAAPVQGQSAKTGRSGPAQVVGGRTQGGVVTAGPQTNPGPMAGQLGEFFGELMKPYVERKQQEKFFEGFAAAAEGTALSELSDSRNPVTKIFGPTAFAEGAQFYTARKATTDYAQQQLANMDELKKLDPAEVPKMLAERARAAMTGDRYADQLIQRSLIEQAGPLMDTIAKKRVEWEQQKAVIAQQGAWGSAADAHQQLMDLQADVTDPSDPRRTAAAASQTNLLGLFVKPEGMTEDSYKRGLKGFLRSAAEKGNFHAITALRKAGIDAIFDDDERTKMEDMYHRYSQQAMSRGAMTYLTDDIGNLEASLAKGDVTPAEAQKELIRMNSVIRTRTGVDEDLFDWKDIKAETRSLMGTIVANYHRAQDRQWQLEDRDASIAEARRQRDEDNEDTKAAVGVAWAHGDVNGAVAGGIEDKHFNRLALDEFRSGQLGGLQRAFVQGQWVSSAVKADVQAGVSASVDQQYGKNMESAYKRWQGMVQTNPGMAAAYYGEWHTKMRYFDMLQKQVGPEAAFTRAFGDSARYSTENIPPEYRKEATKAIAGAVSNQTPGALGRLFGATRVNGSAQRVIAGLATDRLALNMMNSDGGTSPLALANEVITSSMANGSLQVAGEFAWRAPEGTKPFHTQLGLLKDEAGAVFRQVLDRQLRKTGFKDGAEGDNFDINYVRTPDGQTAVHVTARSADASERGVAIIPMSDFRAQHVQNLNAPHSVDDFHRELEARGLSSQRSRDSHGALPKDWRAMPIKFPKFLDHKYTRQQALDHYLSQRKR